MLLCYRISELRDPQRSMLKSSEPYLTTPSSISAQLSSGEPLFKNASRPPFPMTAIIHRYKCTTPIPVRARDHHHRTSQKIPFQQIKPACIHVNKTSPSTPRPSSSAFCTNGLGCLSRLDCKLRSNRQMIAGEVVIRKAGHVS